MQIADFLNGKPYRVHYDSILSKTFDRRIIIIRLVLQALKKTVKPIRLVQRIDTIFERVLGSV